MSANQEPIREVMGLTSHCASAIQQGLVQGISLSDVVSAGTLAVCALEESGWGDESFVHIRRLFDLSCEVRRMYPLDEHPEVWYDFDLRYQYVKGYLKGYTITKGATR